MVDIVIRQHYRGLYENVEFGGARQVNLDRVVGSVLGDSGNTPGHVRSSSSSGEVLAVDGDEVGLGRDVDGGIRRV
jgi:hypothetical protein